MNKICLFFIVIIFCNAFSKQGWNGDCILGKEEKVSDIRRIKIESIDDSLEVKVYEHCNLNLEGDTLKYFTIKEKINRKDTSIYLIMDSVVYASGRWYVMKDGFKKETEYYNFADTINEIFMQNFEKDCPKNDNWKVLGEQLVELRNDTTVKLNVSIRCNNEYGRKMIFSMKNNFIFRILKISQNGYWEVSEHNNLKNTFKYYNSIGSSIINIYDEKHKLLNGTDTLVNIYTSKIIIQNTIYVYDKKDRLVRMIETNGNGDTTQIEKYIWDKNGRLIKTIFNGTERKFIYKKSINDTIRVVPTDKYIGRGDFNPHLGYDGTVGQIPEEGDPDYEIFAKSPYTFHRQK